MYYWKVNSESLDKNQHIISPITMAICVSVVIETKLPAVSETVLHAVEEPGGPLARLHSAHSGDGSGGADLAGSGGSPGLW